MKPRSQNLRQALDSAFSLEELKVICFDLHVEYEDFLPVKGEVIRELLKKLHRENRLIELIEICEEEREEYSWYGLMDEYIHDNKIDGISVSLKHTGIYLGALLLLLLLLVVAQASYIAIVGVFTLGIVVIFILLQEGD